MTLHTPQTSHAHKAAEIVGFYAPGCNVGQCLEKDPKTEKACFRFYWFDKSKTKQYFVPSLSKIREIGKQFFPKVTKGKGLLEKLKIAGKAVRKVLAVTRKKPSPPLKDLFVQITKNFSPCSAKTDVIELKRQLGEWFHSSADKVHFGSEGYQRTCFTNAVALIRFLALVSPLRQRTLQENALLKQMCGRFITEQETLWRRPQLTKIVEKFLSIYATVGRGRAATFSSHSRTRAGPRAKVTRGRSSSMTEGTLLQEFSGTGPSSEEGVARMPDSDSGLDRPVKQESPAASEYGAILPSVNISSAASDTTPPKKSTSLPLVLDTVHFPPEKRGSFAPMSIEKMLEQSQKKSRGLPASNPQPQSSEFGVIPPPDSCSPYE